MSLPNLSTFSSKLGEMRAALRLGGWIAVGLAMLDVAVGALFPFPDDPRTTDPGKVALFFDYGRSTEGRLARMVRADPAQTAPITLAGWYRPLHAVVRTPRPGKPQVTIYGMSHAVRLADALDRTTADFEVRSVGAPGATTNWSYGAFLRDEAGRKSKAVVLSIMSSTLPMITTMTPLTWNRTYPMPYTQDRFYLDNGRLAVRRPPFDSFAGFVGTFKNVAQWRAYRSALAAHDPRYDPLLMRASWLDSSTIVRIIRRAYGQKIAREADRGVIDARAFAAGSEQVRVANAIVADFARRAHAQGQIPIVYIVNNLGYSDQLFRALQTTLERDRIPALNSVSVVSPADPRNYLPDTHFSAENDDLLASELARTIDRETVGGGPKGAEGG